MLTNLLNKLQPQIELVGLDIGTASVKLVQLQKDKDGYTATVAVKEDIQRAEDSKKGSAQIAAAVKRCLAKAGLDGQNVVCGVSGPDVMVRGFKFPPLPQQAIEQAIRFEVQQVCPFESKDLVLDYQLIENTAATPEQKASNVVPRNGVMIACTESAVKQKTTVLNDAGAKALLVDSDALALLNCLNELQLPDANEAMAVIDVGWEFTNVVIYGQDGLPFVRDLQNAGRQIVEKVAVQLELSQDQVRQVLAEQQTDDQTRNKVLLALNDAIRPLAMAINETLRFYSFQEKTAGIEKVFLCGGFSLMKPFREFFADAIPVEVQVLDPFEKIKCQAGNEGNELLKTEGPGLVLAAGLAMRTI